MQKQPLFRNPSTSLKQLLSCMLILLFLLHFVANKVMAQGQGAGGKIQGTIIDSATSKPLPFITIRLVADTGSRSSTMLTQVDGAFRFATVPGKSYSLLITATGYEAKRIDIASADSNVPVKDLGRIALRSKPATLKEVVVTASRPLVRQEADKIVYDLQADPDSKSNSVWEMMRKVPFLSLDGQDNMLLNGSSSYRIFINGKPSGMVERNPKDVLRSIPASTIVSIEVITTPSAKYDAEGQAGIINIITNKKIDAGYSGTLSLNGRYPVGGPGMGGFLNFKKRKLSASLTGGGSIYHTPPSSSFSNRTGLGTPFTRLDQSSTTTFNSSTPYLGTELSYEIDSLHLLSAQFNINTSHAIGTTHQQALLTASGSRVKQYATVNANKTKGTGIDLGLNYQLGFKRNKTRLLTFSYRYLGYRNQQFADLDIVNLFNYPYADYRQANEGDAAEHTFQADYVQTVKWVTIEAGAKAIFRNNNSDYQYQVYDSIKDRFELDATRSNRYQNHQYILAAYNTYQWVSNTWSVKAGLRLEQTIVDADFISTASGVQQQYLSVIPALVISKKLRNGGSLNANYTNRIQRPGINQLNPFVDRSNPSFETTGNPALKPAYTNVFQVSYIQSKKITFNAALGCMLFSDLVSRFTTYDSTSGITRTAYRNIGATQIYKTNLFITYPVSKRVSVRFNSDVRYITGSVSTGKTIISNQGWSAYANLSASYRLGNTWRVNAEATGNSASLNGIQSNMNGFAGFTTNIQKELAKGRLTLAAAINNPFTKYRYSREEVTSSDFTQVNRSQIYYRSFGVSLTYRFGKLKEAVKKNKRGISNDDKVD